MPRSEKIYRLPKARVKALLMPAAERRKLDAKLALGAAPFDGSRRAAYT